MKLVFAGEDGTMGLKHGDIYEVIISTKYNDSRVYVQVNPNNSIGDWPKYSYNSLKSFNKNWADNI